MDPGKRDEESCDFTKRGVFRNRSFFDTSGRTVCHRGSKDEKYKWYCSLCVTCTVPLYAQNPSVNDTDSVCMLHAFFFFTPSVKPFALYAAAMGLRAKSKLATIRMLKALNSRQDFHDSRVWTCASSTANCRSSERSEISTVEQDTNLVYRPDTPKAVCSGAEFYLPINMPVAYVCCVYVYEFQSGR